MQLLKIDIKKLNFKVPSKPRHSIVHMPTISINYYRNSFVHKIINSFNGAGGNHGLFLEQERNCIHFNIFYKEMSD